MPYMLKMKSLDICAICLVMMTISLAASCGKKEQASTPPPEPAQSSAPAPPPAPSAAPSPGAAPQEQPQPGAAAPAPVPAPTAAPASGQAAPAALESAEGELPGITVAIQELKRSPNSVTLKLTFINRSTTPLSFYDAFGEHDLRHIHLVDMAGKKKYFVVQDSHGDCLCSREIKDLSPGAQVALWAKFPPVPDDVQKITVEIPHFPPLEDVIVSR
jgi:hypothetical protein